MTMHRSHRETRTLVVHSGGIGDFLLFCPSLKRLCEQGPVELAGNHRDRLNLAVVAGLAQNTHHLDDVEFASVFVEPSTFFLNFLARFDRAIVWMNDTDGAIARALKRSGVHDVHIYAGLPPPGYDDHASAYYARCLGYSDLPPLVLPFESDDHVHDVLIHPGSGGTRKNWPIERFDEVAQTLIVEGRTVEWIRGPAEENSAFAVGARTLEVPSIVTLARHLSGTSLYIGNDSGVTHLASACRCRTIAIFGETNPNVWAPRGEHVSIVRAAPWPTVDAVLDAIRQSGK